MLVLLHILWLGGIIAPPVNQILKIKKFQSIHVAKNFCAMTRKAPVTYVNPVPIKILIYGQCASKSNSRRIVMRGRKPISIKSASAFEFAQAFEQQCPQFDEPMTGDLKLDCTIYYRSRRSDLDDTLVCDLLQKCGVIKNDRQIQHKVLRCGIDKHRPRVEITLTHMGEEDYPKSGFIQAYLRDMPDEGYPINAQT